MNERRCCSAILYVYKNVLLWQAPKQSFSRHDLLFLADSKAQSNLLCVFDFRCLIPFTKKKSAPLKQSKRFKAFEIVTSCQSHSTPCYTQIKSSCTCRICQAKGDLLHYPFLFHTSRDLLIFS